MNHRKMESKRMLIIPAQAEKKELDFLHLNRKTTSMTWIGHSTFLIQLDGLNILTDPVWASFIGLKRRISEPGISLDELPAIDVVLISNGHRDHLHFPTLRRLKGEPLYLVPSGLEDLFIRKGLVNVKELPWWGRFEKTPVQFTFVPAQLDMGKGPFYRSKALYGGWVCRHRKKQVTIYFAGDTAYFPGFTEIGRNFPVDLAVLPIGPNKPGWLQKASHLSPEKAVQAFLDLQAQCFVPMHYGTFDFGDDSGNDPLNRLQAEWNRAGLPAEKLRIFALGETWRTDLLPGIEASSMCTI